MSSRLLIGIIILIVILVALGFILYNRITLPELENTDLVEEEEAARGILVNLFEQNDSGITGTAYLLEVRGELKVIFDFKGAPENLAQPAHIHANTCADIGGVVHPLDFPVNGYSETILPLTLDEVLAHLPLSINVHKSAEEPQIYVACGDIQ